MKTRVIVLVVTLFVVSLLYSPAYANHHFIATNIKVCRNGLQAVGEPTFVTALNLNMTIQVGNEFFAPVIATGNSHTFTSIGEQFLFFISYSENTFSVGQSVTIGITEAVDGTVNDGNEGFTADVFVQDCLFGSFGGPGIPPGFVLRTITCNVAVFDTPGGSPVGANRIIGGQTWYVNPVSVKASNGDSWTEIFVSGTPNSYIPARCVG
jgi:hypothetical protein